MAAKTRGKEGDGMNGDIGDRPFRPVAEALDLIVEPGTVVELRAIGVEGRISSGYFDDKALLATAAEVLDDTCEYSGIYLTLNPVNTALLARRANRVKRRLDRKDTTTADADILRRRWLPIDVDPVRPSGVSATLEEHSAARATMLAICEALTKLGWPRPIVADSGNGGHLLYRIDLPNDDASTQLIKGVLAELDRRFSDGVAKVDAANYNAARIWKVYGTVSRKGDSTKDRPHNRSSIIAKAYEIEVVPVSLLQSLVASTSSPDPPSPSQAAPVPTSGGFNLGTWLRDHEVAVKAERPWQGGTLYNLEHCPFSDAHTDGAYAIQFGNGAIHAGCKHDSCGGGKQRWQELRARFEPAASEPAKNPDRPVEMQGKEASASSTAAISEPGDTVVAKAREVLARGDPVQYFLDCFEHDHVGDVTLAHCLVMSIASQTVRNSAGLHVYVTGESGKGKSSGMMAMLRQVPEEYRLAERMSNKALYYSNDINPCTVLLLDDIALSEELQEVLKEATTKFDEPVRMRVVNRERRVQVCSIPERCVWWLANVSALYDEQVLNRMLVCWVDDSETQDREVFRRRMLELARPADEVVGDRFELQVCRELWRRLRAEGLVYVEIPFGDRIRMASVRNRRNPGILVDLIRSRALVFRFQRGRRTLPDGGVVVTATEEDFRYAARLFAELNTASGSLEAKYDRNEQLVLSLAEHYGAEQFGVADVQRWTGWQYQKARRTLCGYEGRNVRYPGLIDKSPALSMADQSVNTLDPDGREVRRRARVFTFDVAVYRKSRAAGQAWLVDRGVVNSMNNRKDAVERTVVHDHDGCHMAEPENGGDSAVSPQVVNNKPNHKEHRPPSIAAMGNGSKTAPDAPVQPDAPVEPDSGSEDATSSAFDPHAFLALDGPTFEPCSACGTKPSYYRERWVKGMKDRRRLCKRCYGAAVKRAQTAVQPLPTVIRAGSMERITISVGRCQLCRLEKAAWSGDGVCICETCYQREVRRGIEIGEAAVSLGDA